jgi:hypothetical protein
MNTIRSIVSMHTYRIPPRLKLVASRLSSLLLLFQRAPLVQFLFPEANIMGGASLANSFTLGITTVVGLGVFDSVSGQSQISQKAPLNVLGLDPAGTSPTAANAINVPATVSAPLTFSFNWDPLDDYSTVKSWRATTGGVAGTLPVGLSPALNPSPSPAVGVGGLITIAGTVATPGIYPVKINVYRSASYGSSTAAQIFNICVLGFSAQPTATPSSISSGGTSSLTCTAIGNPVPTTLHPATAALTYQWYRGTTGDTTTPVGTTNSTTPGFTTPALTTSTNYWVRLRSVLGASTVYANSNTVAVTVSAPASVVTVTVAPASVSEDGASNLVYTFARTGDTTAALTTNFSVGGSATYATDYAQSGAASFTASSGTLTIPAGSSSAAVTVDPTLDNAVEPNETVDLTVIAGAGYTVGAPSLATGTINNDDTAYSSWASVLPPGQSGPNQMPQKDGVTNLEKFAFNMDPLQPDVRKLTVGAGGTVGLPGQAVVGGTLRLEFLRRKASTNPGITYTAQFGSNLAGWVDIPVGTPAGTPIGSPADPIWERVVVDDPAPAAKRFGRLKVVQP